MDGEEFEFWLTRMQNELRIGNDDFNLYEIFPLLHNHIKPGNYAMNMLIQTIVNFSITGHKNADELPVLRNDILTNVYAR